MLMFTSTIDYIYCVIVELAYIYALVKVYMLIVVN